MDERIIYREGYANTLQGGAKTLAVSAATAHANFFGSLYLIILSTIWISGPGTVHCTSIVLMKSVAWLHQAGGAHF